jgi:glycosidase
MTLRGTPFIYYGEELGMTGSGLRRGELKDPLSRRTWPLRRFCRDMARTPMQWDDSPDAGFSGADARCVRTGARTDANGVSISAAYNPVRAGAAHDLAQTEAAACSSAATDTDCSWTAVAGTGIKPWLPVAKDYQSKNVKLQSQDEASLLSFYRRLIWLRKKHKVLQDGGIRFFEKNLPDALIYLREKEGGERMLVILNFSEKNLLVSQIDSFISDPDSQNNPETQDTTALVLLGTHRLHGMMLKLLEPIPVKSYEVLIAQL